MNTGALFLSPCSLNNVLCMRKSKPHHLPPHKPACVPRQCTCSKTLQDFLFTAPVSLFPQKNFGLYLLQADLSVSKFSCPVSANTNNLPRRHNPIVLFLQAQVNSLSVHALQNLFVLFYSPPFSSQDNAYFFPSKMDQPKPQTVYSFLCRPFLQIR